ncbi:MAG: signal peptide peptidase SppA [Bacteroidota bacterium]
MAFLRIVLGTVVGLLLFFFIGMIMLFGAIGAASSGEAPTVKDKSVLYLNLSGPVAERVAEDPFQEFFPESGPLPIALLPLIDAIGQAKDDSRIEGIYMEHGFIQSGYASLQEIRDALLDFKRSGKFVYSYGEYLSEADYYLASVADQVFLNPEGSLEFNGLSVGVSFFKGTFEKLGIEPQIFRVGEFKSAVEPFIRKDLSDANRLQINSFISSINEHSLRSLAQNSELEFDELKTISDSMLVRLPEDAEEYGLVTRIAYEDEMKSLIREEIGIEDDKKIRFIKSSSYIKALKMEGDDYSSNRIAVIVASGNIVMGDGGEEVGGEKFAREIRKARENDRVKAIVLRVNSPGGSLTGSDIIWREIMLTKGVKPIIASMSDLAASGGYYISMPCDTIVAQPNTITGSIGIFGMLFNFEEFLEDKMGITNDVVSTGEFSDIFTVSRSLTDYEKSIIQEGIERGYETFITKAAEGRGMSREALENVASGRVWTGEQALSNGLVDVLGDFNTAVNIAAKSAGIEDDYRLSYYPALENFFDQFLSKAAGEADAYYLNRQFGEMAPYVESINKLKTLQGIQARLPYDLTIQ